MLKCANPAVLINLQCPTTQVRLWVMPPLAAHSYTTLCCPPTFPPRLIMQDWWAFSLRGGVVSSSSVSPSALTDLQLSWMRGIPKIGNITGNSASRALRLAARWEQVVRGLFCLLANWMMFSFFYRASCLNYKSLHILRFVVDALLIKHDFEKRHERHA